MDTYIKKKKKKNRINSFIVWKYLTEDKEVRKMGSPTNCAFFSLLRRTFACYYQSTTKREKIQLSTTFRIAKPIAANPFSFMAVAGKTPIPQSWLFTILQFNLKQLSIQHVSGHPQKSPCQLFKEPERKAPQITDIKRREREGREKAVRWFICSFTRNEQKCLRA